MTKSTAATRRRSARRVSKAEKKRLDDEKKRQWQEQQDEAIAPAAQREDVVAGGAVVRGARLQRDGVTFIRSNPVRRMYERGRGKGETATVRKAHLDACERLVRAWEDGAAGIGSVPSLLGERTAAMPQTGYISDQRIASIAYQTNARDEFVAAIEFLGALWPVVKRVVLDAADLAVWAQETRQPPDRAAGYLQAALDRLVEFYQRRDMNRRGRMRIVR